MQRSKISAFALLREVPPAGFESAVILVSCIASRDAPSSPARRTPTPSLVGGPGDEAAGTDWCRQERASPTGD
jgi:hypothetical protein